MQFHDYSSSAASTLEVRAMVIGRESITLVRASRERHLPINAESKPALAAPKPDDICSNGSARLCAHAGIDDAPSCSGAVSGTEMTGGVAMSCNGAETKALGV